MGGRCTHAPMESQIINRAFNKLIKENGFPHVVFHSLRHSSITYKLKLNGGDMKAVQGDSGHAQMKMVADVYSHIIDEDRCINAQRFEDAFYLDLRPGGRIFSAGEPVGRPGHQNLAYQHAVCEPYGYQSQLQRGR